MESILIKLPQQADDSAEWVVIDHGGHPHAAIRNGPLNAAEPHSQQRHVMALAPTTDLVINEVGFPSKNRRKLRQAVPYILEDQFAEDVDDMHFAIGQFSQSDESEDTTSGLTIPVAAIQQSKLDAWLAQFSSSNIQLKTLIPDVLALPFEENCWSILIKDDTSLIRTNVNSGFACDSCNLQIILDATLFKTDDKPNTINRLLVWDYTNTEGDERFPIQSDIEVDYQATDLDPMSLMARGLRLNSKSRNHFNLLQGDYSPQEEYGKFIRPWYATAILLGSLILLSFISNIIELSRLETQEKALFSEMKNIYKTNFPDAKNLTKPRLFMKQKLKALGVSESGSGSLFFTYLTAISDVLPRHNATLKSISYNKQQLDVELDISSVQALDKLKLELASKYKLEVKINAATPEDGKVVSRLRIKGTSS